MLPGASDLQVREGAIDFEGIGFSYGDGDAKTQVFDDFELHIPAGQRVGLVGLSGAGKTTLTKLLLRLSDIQQGCILLMDKTSPNARSSRCVAKSPTCRRNRCCSIAVLPRISRMASPAPAWMRFAKRRRVRTRWNSSSACLQGFETQVGERGVKLSGGQRQRIAIARAILADCPVLVLDEATSALDSESEALVQDALATLMKGRTCIVVAHRLSTVASLDRIVVLDSGKVAEDGPHEQLIADGGEYANLWNRQTGAYLE